MDNVDMVWISICYPVEFEQNVEGVWIWKYVRNAKGRTTPILVSKTISYVELYDKVKHELNVDSRLHKMEMLCLVPKMFKAPAAPVIIDCDNNVKWFISICRENPLCITLSENVPENRELYDITTCLSRVEDGEQLENMNRDEDLVHTDDVAIVEWKISEHVTARKVFPPLTRTRSDQPSKKRKKIAGETRKPRKCSKCKKIGHNRSTCLSLGASDDQ